MGRPKLPPGKKKIQVAIYPRRSLIALADAARGDLPFSRYVVEAIRQRVDRDKAANAPA